MAKDWAQIADDFQQKYVGTFCRYVSPLTKNKEVFMITSVQHNAKGPFSFTLYHPKYGEILLNYDTDTDLDFTYPDVGFFQHGRCAYRLTRKHLRQWKKGISESTVDVDFPYARIYPYHKGIVDHAHIEAAFVNRTSMDIKTAMAQLRDKDLINVVLNSRFSLGLGLDKGKNLLWFEEEPIALVDEEGIHLSLPIFRQELDDYMRDTGTYVRVIQAP